ncbi:hypothetical protein HMPREF3039_02148 [Akkermansia sp. KLE1798]|nr:hypothetical protein HMPREF3039_02148 [Akkermansia sp. KLE1798]KZA03897.1 hypothetical protein HMPREF1326_02437 [Akkermansia sp. KLE1605]
MKITCRETIAAENPENTEHLKMKNRGRARNLPQDHLRTAHEPVNHRNASAWFDWS